MSKIIQRLLVFFIGVPFLMGIVFLLPHYHHLAINLVVLIVSVLGAVEFSVLLAQKELYISKIEAAILGALPSLVMILIINLNLDDLWLSVLVAAVVSWLLVSRLISHGDQLDSFINRIIAGFAVLLYPGMLLSWMVRMSQWEEISGFIIITFLTVVFCTDGAAWATGMMFGKGNQGLIPASPNKSIAGFIGGTIVSILLGGIAAVLLPEVFIPKAYSIFGIPFVAGAVLGLLTGVAATLGDLGESAIKRSSGLKDSGSIIPGRGGILDSIDSLTLAAPVFYLVFSLLFIHP
jgi:phosphatidate cytidylyltransferase